MNVYVFSQPVNLSRPCDVCKIVFNNDTEKNKYISANLHPNEHYKIVDINDISNIPFYFLSSCNIVNDELVPDISAAKRYLLKDIRYKREKLLAPLDVAFMRAVERGDTAKQQEIGAQKQKLRDITVHPAIENATTLEELASYTIEKLLETQQ
jgi:hypothetical protein